MPTFQTVMSSMFWDIALCTPVKVNLALLAAGFMLEFYLAHSCSLKMMAIMFLQNAVHFHQTTWVYIPENRTLQSHCCKTLRPSTSSCVYNKTLLRPCRLSSVLSTISMPIPTQFKSGTLSYDAVHRYTQYQMSQPHSLFPVKKRHL